MTTTNDQIDALKKALKMNHEFMLIQAEYISEIESEEVVSYMNKIVASLKDDYEKLMNQ